MGAEFEEAVRLRTRFTTLRELFVHSGNQCAFPDCVRRLVNEKGQWVGEVCHIEAALPGGERFNPKMTNEERRGGANLMLMCHDHHVETNDETEFTVEMLRDFKARHEGAFSGVPSPLSDKALEAAVEEIAASDVIDQTDRVVLRPPQTLAKFGDLVDLGWTPEELRSSIELVEPGLKALRRVPLDARAVFAIVVDRGSDYADDLGVPAHEIEEAAAIDGQTLANHVRTLERYRLAGFEEEYEGEWGTTTIFIRTRSFDGWGFWRLLKIFCERAELKVKPVINELRFDQLD